MINRTWLVTLVRNIPYPIVFIEAVRFGLDVKNFVRVTICGIDCGIWKWNEN